MWYFQFMLSLCHENRLGLTTYLSNIAIAPFVAADLCYGEENFWAQVGTNLLLYDNVSTTIANATVISCGVECTIASECQGFVFWPWDGLCILHDAADVTKSSLT